MIEIKTVESIWLAAALLTFEKYYKTENHTKEQMYLKQSDIVKLASDLHGKEVPSTLASSQCVSNSNGSLYNYLVGGEGDNEKGRRISFWDEFYNEKERPNLSPNITLNTSQGEKTIGEIYNFVKNEYSELFSSAERDELLTKTRCMFVLDYLTKYAGKSYVGPEKARPAELDQIYEIKNAGIAAVKELDNMAKLCELDFGLKKYGPSKWLDGSNTKIRGYLWRQMKFPGYEDCPSSISLFAEIAEGSFARFRFSVELNDAQSEQKDYERHHKILERNIKLGTDLVYAIGGNSSSISLKLIKESTEEVKQKVGNGTYKKVQVSFVITKEYIDENKLYDKDVLGIMVDAIKDLIPFYKLILGEEITKKSSTILSMNLKDFREVILSNADFLKRLIVFRKNRGNAEITDWVMCSIYGTINNNESNPYPDKVISNNKQSAGTTARNNVTNFFQKIGFSSNSVGRVTPEMQEFMTRVYKQDAVSDAIKVMSEALTAYPDMSAILEKFVGEVLTEEGTVTEMPDELVKTCKEDKNIILYGPPGTGKTYNTVLYAVAIIDNVSIDVLEEKPYEEVFRRYLEFKESGIIAFTTFHQSYGYEEFIEGIKPVIESQSETSSDDVKYEYSDGVFKKFCNKAKKVKIQKSPLGINENPTVWNVILEGPGLTELKKECFEKHFIKIGWSKLDKIISEETAGLNALERRILLNFQDEMEEGDIVLVQRDNTSIDAIGIITGPYEFLENEKNYPRKRNVNWIVTGINENVLGINQNIKLDRKSIYPLRNMDIKDVLKLVEKYNQSTEINVQENLEPYVFIIDEINRGNISKIFGELITLIESTKRVGEPEETTANLPYTGDPFGVPNNVYIIGTMNTADRSIALMDTALRRRFRFIEMMPKAEILKRLNIIDIEGIDIIKMIEVINERIEYLYDREHTIGHAYFTSLAGDLTLERLGNIFQNAIIPLLQEYFYEDYRKIQLVLGDNAKEDKYKFILDTDVKVRSVFKGNVDVDLPEKKYSIQNDAFYNKESYIQIYE
jgi:5-methylcytosine-specific restriction endonuclease McrBC GTP-binding regulatory subunit McrB